MNQLVKMNIGIIGCGKVGTALAVLFSEQPDLPNLHLFSRSVASTKTAAEQIKSCKIYEDLKTIVSHCDLIFLTVSDDKLCEVIEKVSGFQLNLNRKFFLHCSGSYSSAVFAPLEKFGAMTGSMHPLQTFPTALSGAENLAGSFCAFESNHPAMLIVLREIVDVLKLKAVEIKPEDKMLYHIAACIGCNYLTVLIDAAANLMEQSGFDRKQALEALSPIMRQTLENGLNKDPVGTLTGPIARGDKALIKQHFKLLNERAREYKELYSAVGKHAEVIAEKQNPNHAK